MGIFTKVFKGTESGEVKANMTEFDMTGGVVKEGTSRSSSGTSVSITEDIAMKIASLYQGINIIADTIASMPVYLYKDEDGFQQTYPLDPRSKALTDMANDIMTAYNLKKNLVKDMILHGNGYAKIRYEGKKLKLDYLPTSVVTPKKDSTGYYFSIQAHATDVMGENIPAEAVDYFDMLTLVRNPQYNSIVGKGLLDYASDIFDMSIQETNYMINLFKNGLSAKAVLNSKTPFKREVKEQLKRDLTDLYSGASNSGKMMVLEGDISVLPLSLTPTDIKLIENKHFTISEIARFLNIPKHMLSLDRQQGTYSNITQERLQLLQNTLTPYVVAIEGALNQKLLTEQEQDQGYYFQFNTNEMLKLTPEDNAKYMLDLYREDVVTIEEVRATLNLGGDAETIEQLKQYDAVKQQQILAQQAQSKESKPVEEVVEEETTTEEKEEVVKEQPPKKSKKES